MATPEIYTRFANASERVLRSAGWKLIAGVAVVAFLPAVLERTVPAIGDVPGGILFVLLITFFFLIAPLYAFRTSTATQSSERRQHWAWIKAILCDLWFVFCIWLIYLAFFGKT